MYALIFVLLQLLKKQSQQDEAIQRLCEELATMLILFRRCLDLKEIDGVPLQHKAAEMVIKGAELIDRIMKFSFIGMS